MAQGPVCLKLNSLTHKALAMIALQEALPSILDKKMHSTSISVACMAQSMGAHESRVTNKRVDISQGHATESAIPILSYFPLVFLSRPEIGLLSNRFISAPMGSLL